MDKTSVEELIELTAVRQAGYQLLARLWAREVDAALWRELQAATFPAMPEFPALDAAYRQLVAWLQDAGTDALDDLAADYAILCLAADPNEGADPYESVHRNPLHIMMQDEWEAVLLLYAELGLQRSPSATEPEDHLGIELECMARLCERAAQRLAQGDIEALATLNEQQKTMLDQHLLLWVPRFTGEVLRLAKTEFYKAVAVITREYLALDRDLLNDLVSDLEQPTGELMPAA